MDVSTWSDVGLVAILDRGLWSVELETEPKAGTSSVSGDWKKCKDRSSIRMLKREHESAEYYDRLLAIAEGYVEGTALRR
ncbi:MAG: hypothetical protein BGO98_46230 [Myxococcales bacterium 68-20]|nr:MAG: hypothetical protein BGO98_46230 [Myxococcales bacterium 68-20]